MGGMDTSLINASAPSSTAVPAQAQAAPADLPLGVAFPAIVKSGRTTRS